VDEFFENVMVNAEDKDVRINRLTLLSKLRELFLQVADISLLQVIGNNKKPACGQVFYTKI
jgi:glycyl-tRNA synthetase beta chain